MSGQDDTTSTGDDGFDAVRDEPVEAPEAPEARTPEGVVGATDDADGTSGADAPDGSGEDAPDDLDVALRAAGAPATPTAEVVEADQLTAQDSGTALGDAGDDLDGAVEDGAGEGGVVPGRAPGSGGVDGPDDRETATRALIAAPAAAATPVATPVATPAAAPAAGAGPAVVPAATDAQAPDEPAVPVGERTAAGAEEPPAAEAPVSPGRRRMGLVALAAAVLVLLVAAVVLGLQWRGDRLDEQARQDALTAARQSALNLTSIDREDFDADVDRVLDGATGEFRQDFAGRVQDLQKVLQDNEVSAEGRVLEAAVVRSDRRSATALVVVDSTVRNKTVPDGRVNSYRMKLELERVGDRWLTSSLEFVG